MSRIDRTQDGAESSVGEAYHPATRGGALPPPAFSPAGFSVLIERVTELDSLESK